MITRRQFLATSAVALVAAKQTVSAAEKSAAWIAKSASPCRRSRG